MSWNFAVEVLEHNIVVLVVYMYALNIKQGKHTIFLFIFWLQVYLAKEVSTGTEFASKLLKVSVSDEDISLCSFFLGEVSE